MSKRAAAALVALLLAQVLTAAPARADTEVESDPLERGPLRVLFVGNSLTYTGDLPGVVASLAEAQGHALRTEAVLGPGAQIEHHAARGFVQRQLASRNYDWLVLQEQGGSLLCVEEVVRRKRFDCSASRDAHRDLVAAATASGTQTVLLGTAQANEALALHLQRAEVAMQQVSRAAAHAPIALAFARGLASDPGARWFVSASDSHPGRDTTMLMALSLYRVLFDAEPTVAPSRIRVRRHDSGGPFDPGQVASRRRPVPTTVFQKFEYERMATLSALLAEARSDFAADSPH